MSAFSWFFDFLQTLAKGWNWLEQTKFNFFGNEINLLTALTSSLGIVIGGVIVAKLVSLVIPL